jgi:hypothetical protein
LLAGCAGDAPLRDAPPPPRPADVRAQIVGLMPAGTADRTGWATDIYAALSALEVSATPANICAVLAVIEQESTYRADPEVPKLGQIAWGEIDRRAERLGVPSAAVHLALKLPSSNGKSYAERIDAVKTEKELSLVFEDLIDRVPLGKRLFASWNPVHRRADAGRHRLRRAPCAGAQLSLPGGRFDTSRSVFATRRTLLRHRPPAGLSGEL